ncbi:MAG: efflux RND transporter periplasmic adaptor subunit [Acetobacteraceae bacterium]
MRHLVKSGLCLAALAGAGLYGTHLVTAPSRAAAPVAPPAPVPVVTADVQQKDVPITLTGLGTVQALNTATIRSQITGVLQSVNFTEGQQVHRGDVLAQIDPRPLQAKLVQAQAQLRRDQAQLANTQVNLNRDLPLLKNGYATDQQVTNEKYQVAQLQSAAESDQAAVDDARTQLSYATLTAPFDGVTGVRTLDVGNVIHPTDANGLVVVTQVQPIGVLFTLPAADIAQVQDALAKGPVPATVTDQSGQTVLDTGQLLLMNNQANANSGTVQLKALFPNLARRLWPGTFVNVELTAAVANGGATVPTDAIQLGPTGNFAFVVGADGKAVVRPVTVGQLRRGEALVTKGLTPGEAVVTQGQYRLTAGTPVASAPPSQVAASSTASAGLLP